uniref:Secreted protein n=1 Tax=Ascaris lumbricoides TaxID=6252 RepID=A0A0M3IJX1_ASCLU
MGNACTRWWHLWLTWDTINLTTCRKRGDNEKRRTRERRPWANDVTTEQGSERCDLQDTINLTTCGQRGDNEKRRMRERRPWANDMTTEQGSERCDLQVAKG